MINNFLTIILIILIISPSLSAYQSLKKYNGFDKLNDNICGYEYSSVTYVKMCDEGKYCKKIDDLYMCVDREKEIKKKYLDETCTKNDGLFDECDNNLSCNTNNKCARISDCSSSSTIYKTDNGNYQCKPNDMPAGLYYYAEYDNSYNPTKEIPSGNINGISKDYGKVGGKITFIHDNSNHYYVTKKENAYIGTVKNGEFVEDSSACESGYALLFYPDGGLTDPSSSSPNVQYYKCVSVNSIDIYKNGDCAINYDDDKIYYFTSSSSNPPSECDEYLMTRLEIFKKYIGKFTSEKQESCSSNKENYNEPDTCNDDELRKWYYFLKKPEHYILYYEKNDKPNDVVNFLIQQDNKLYQFSNFISIRYLLLLLILTLI